MAGWVIESFLLVHCIYPVPYLLWPPISGLGQVSWRPLRQVLGKRSSVATLLDCCNLLCFEGCHTDALAPMVEVSVDSAADGAHKYIEVCDDILRSQRAAVGALAVLGLLQQTFQDLFVFCFLPGRHEGALRVALQSARAD